MSKVNWTKAWEDTSQAYDVARQILDGANIGEWRVTLDLLNYPPQILMTCTLCPSEDRRATTILPHGREHALYIKDEELLQVSGLAANIARATELRAKRIYCIRDSVQYVIRPDYNSYTNSP